MQIEAKGDLTVTQEYFGRAWQALTLLDPFKGIGHFSLSNDKHWLPLLALKFNRKARERRFKEDIAVRLTSIVDDRS